MIMNLKQTKLVSLIAELDLRAREYRKLCDRLEKLKESNIDENDPGLLILKELFEVNNKQIVEINKQLKELQSDK